MLVLFSIVVGLQWAGDLDGFQMRMAVGQLVDLIFRNLSLRQRKGIGFRTVVIWCDYGHVLLLDLDLIRSFSAN